MGQVLVVRKPGRSKRGGFSGEPGLRWGQGCSKSPKLVSRPCSFSVGDGGSGTASGFRRTGVGSVKPNPGEEFAAVLRESKGSDPLAFSSVR